MFIPSGSFRDRWHGHAHYPYVRAAGTWVTRAGTLPSGLAAEAKDADELLRLTLQQLDDGADLVKLYLDGPDPETAPWTAGEVQRVESLVMKRRAVSHSLRRLIQTPKRDTDRIRASTALAWIEQGSSSPCALRSSVSRAMPRRTASRGWWMLTGDAEPPR